MAVDAVASTAAASVAEPPPGAELSAPPAAATEGARPPVQECSSGSQAEMSIPEWSGAADAKARVQAPAPALGAEQNDSESDEFRKAARPLIKQTSFASTGDMLLQRPPSTALVALSAACAAMSTVVEAMSWEKLDRRLGEVHVIQALAAYLNVKPMTIFTLAATGCLGFFLFGLGGQLICTGVGALYPAFETFKVLESKKADPQLMQFWLTYWVVFAMITSAEFATFYVIAMLPFYYPMKLAFLMYLTSPSYGGAVAIYRWVIAPTFASHQESIDYVLDESRARVRRGVNGAVHGALDAGLGTAQGARALGINSLKRGISMVRPGIGGLTTLCLEAATAVGSRARSATHPKLQHAFTEPAMHALEADEGEEGEEGADGRPSVTASAAVGAAAHGVGEGEKAKRRLPEPPVFNGGEPKMAAATLTATMVVATTVAVSAALEDSYGAALSAEPALQAPHLVAAS